ncbi:MAG: hypothetical protein D4R67_03105 [Bacteroidetes bacterium]|nr:MAG: hypothetical protein D4R67_03105 [Bacteroidota bacterium]
MKVARSVRIVFCVGCFSVNGLVAQTYLKQPDPGFANRWNLGITLGPDFYYGDLAYGSSGPRRNVSLAGSLVIGYQISNVFGARLQLMGAWLNGSADSIINGEVVQNPLTGILLEGNLQAVINFNNIFSPYRSSRWFFLYGTAGVGYAAWYTEFSNQAYDAGTINTNNPLNNFHTSVVFPLGIGALFRLGDRVNASVEYTFHLVGSDLLDQTALRGNNDRFDYLAFGISLNLGKGQNKKIPVYTPVYTPPPSRARPKILDPTLPRAEEPVAEPPPITQPQPLTYSVQICAYAQHIYSTEWIRKRYRVPMEVRKEQAGKMERFLAGSCADLGCARKLREQMIRLGIRDAFIVAYRNGVRDHIVKE